MNKYCQIFYVTAFEFIAKQPWKAVLWWGFAAEGLKLIHLIWSYKTMSCETVGAT
jgi:DMSO/TMAO reductase YedYZ heme-binding membrane subunit